MILQSLLDVVLLLVEPLSAAQLIAAGVLVVSGVFNRMFRTYITYVLTNSENGKVYVGRTSGFGEPIKILKRRLYNHEYIKKGFTDIQIDKAVQGRNAKDAIRGREQQMIDFYGGIGNTNVANIKRGVGKKNARRYFYHEMANRYFGEIAYFTGNTMNI